MRYLLLVVYIMSFVVATGQGKNRVRGQRLPAKADAQVSAKSPTLPDSAPLQCGEDIPTPPYDIKAYLKSNLRYPDSALANNIQGRIVVKFVVNEDGSCSDFVVVRGLGYGCDEEAIRLLKRMQPWTPGRHNGKPAKAQMYQPVIFTLE